MLVVALLVCAVHDAPAVAWALLLRGVPVQWQSMHRGIQRQQGLHTFAQKKKFGLQAAKQATANSRVLPLRDALSMHAPPQDALERDDANGSAGRNPSGKSGCQRARHVSRAVDVESRVAHGAGGATRPRAGEDA